MMMEVEAGSAGLAATDNLDFRSLLLFSLCWFLQDNSGQTYRRRDASAAVGYTVWDDQRVHRDTS